jgi:hypothetical protein
MKQGFDLVINMNISKLIEHDTIATLVFFSKKTYQTFSVMFLESLRGEFSLNILENYGSLSTFFRF